MANNKPDQAYLSPNRKAFRRLLKNRPAVFGMITIALAIIIAIFAYLIIPDATPNANDQIVELALKDPGFDIKILRVAKNRTFVAQSIFTTLLFGKPNSYQQIPINTYSIQGDSIYLTKYRGKDQETGTLLPGKPMRFHLVDLAYAVNAESMQLTKKADTYQFVDLKGRPVETSATQLRQTIEKDLITERSFYLGTDKFGRCMLSRLILGVRISLLVGLIAVVISLTIGILLGAIAGYFGGKIDDFIMLIINTAWSIPTLLLVFAIVLALGRGVSNIFIAVGLTMWVDVARIVRGQVIGLRDIQFVEAAQSMGFRTGRIILRHILPNILGPVMVIAAANFATAILLEAGLSYLGFGIQPPKPSWGTMLNENYGYAISGKPFLAVVPAVAIMLLVLAFNLIGNGFRDALDVKSRN